MPAPIPCSVALVSARDADPFAQHRRPRCRYNGRTLETYRLQPSPASPTSTAGSRRTRLNTTAGPTDDSRASDRPDHS